METQKQIRKETWLVLALISVGIVCLLWAIHANAVIGDAYAALVLALVLVTLGALGSFIVTTEIRDNLSRNSRAIIHALHMQQVNALQNENDELRANIGNIENARQVWNDEYKMKSAELTNLANRYAELRAKHSRLENSVMDIRETLDYTLVNDEYTHSASTAFALGTLDLAYIVNGETRYPLQNR